MIEYLKEGNYKTICKIYIQYDKFTESLVNRIYNRVNLSNFIKQTTCGFRVILEDLILDYVSRRYKQIVDIDGDPYFYLQATATRNPEDKEDEEYGKQLAFYRAKLKRIQLESDVIYYINGILEEFSITAMDISDDLDNESCEVEHVDMLEDIADDRRKWFRDIAYKIRKSK